MVTATPQGPIWRFRGWVCQGTPPAGISWDGKCQGTTPLGGVHLTLHGWNDGETPPGNHVKTTTTDVSGFYNFHILENFGFDHYELEVIEPTGLVGIAAIAETGVVQTPPTSVIVLNPGPEVHFTDFYMLPPTPTPTDTPTPTPQQRTRPQRRRPRHPQRRPRIRPQQRRPTHLHRRTRQQIHRRRHRRHTHSHYNANPNTVDRHDHHQESDVAGQRQRFRV